MAAPTDVLQCVLADIQTAIAALDLGPPCVVRKGPKKEPTVDPAPQITISMQAAGEKKIYQAFGHMTTMWPIEVTYIAASKRDYVYGFPQDTSYRQQIETLYTPPLSLATLFPTTPGIWEVRIRPNEFLPRGEIADGIDRTAIVLEVKTAT
jgi:hypothetical protein